MNIRPTSFIQPNTEVLVKFKNDQDEYEYFKGVVVKILQSGENYVICHIRYEDGEDVPESVLYDGDFEEPQHEDTWKFASDMSLVIKYMIKNQQELNMYKDIVEKLEEEYIDEQSEKSSEISEIPELAPPTKKEDSIINFFLKIVIVHLPLVWLFYRYDLCFCKA